MIELRRLQEQQGLTLIELVVAMVVISIALGGVLLVMNYTTSHSADPMLRQQSLAIAESYMEEITLKSYLDPDDGALCPSPEASRADYDNVCDFNGMTQNGARDQSGTLISGLGGYQVAVTVTSQNFGSPAVAGLKVKVQVTDPAGQGLILIGYRADF